MKIPTITLSDGAKMPQLGVGTFLVTGDSAIGKISSALKMGYRMIDTAQGFGNEAPVGEAIRQAGIPREELFITTKIAPDAMRNGTVRQSIDESLAKLGTDYIDLLLIHWPVAGHIGVNPKSRFETSLPYIGCPFKRKIQFGFEWPDTGI